MSASQFGDVRMRGFQHRTDVDTVLALLDARTAPLPAEPVHLLNAAGRVLAEPVVSAVDVPGFARAAMDGFAVRSADTTPTHPEALTVIGESMPGRAFAGEVGPREAVRITTGAPIPPGADAVLMVEFAHPTPNGGVRPIEAVGAGKHVVRVGEDVARGAAVLPTGRCLRPQDVGLLASIGVDTVRAVRQPRVAILATGNELLAPGEPVVGYRIADSNSPMLSALAARDGADIVTVRRIPDDFDALGGAVRSALADADVILVTGGSSVGSEDHAPRVAASLGELLVHGVAVRPAGPMGVAFLNRPGAQARVPLFLIPGNPVACLCAYDLFAGRVVRRLGGRAWELPYQKRTLPLAEKLVSAVGRVDYVRVKVEGNLAVPLVRAGATNLSTAVSAAGFVLVPAARDALMPGELVDVWLYDTL
jgi:molybdopterin molybdotransferase